jgi:hypothetical protein
MTLKKGNKSKTSKRIGGGTRKVQKVGVKNKIKTVITPKKTKVVTKSGGKRTVTKSKGGARTGIAKKSVKFANKMQRQMKKNR